ncbi:DUF1649-domain-containing protein [Gloeophyllum trabeum ATCC 11539]|uniref:Autophagy-related protein 101 n=1 Tax=Gloeophyllum trabeum (strain ATCC 11539 / FP-39264 / Madison 617) TaxID=670483 RepID=S7QJR6_GLOTA|nr:DUF1649-domain-containing protein [Gloeophyllum trabeum ATCC 11539]EPQ59946.1 DUF1649-domain-containing protein [Gloeophyllum trabeum ATCC 11539]
MTTNTNALPTVTIDLVLDRRSTTEVLSAVLHAILFHRLFGTVKPTTFQVQDITIPGVDDADTKQLVDEKVHAFWRAMEGGPSKRGQIIVTFAEKRARKGWFYMGEEEVPWEQWIVNAEIRQPKSEQDRVSFNADLASSLTKALQTMLTHISSETGRKAVPLITSSTGISPFPFKVLVKVNGAEVG